MQPSPLRFVEAVNGHQKAAVARAAIELDVFTHIAQGRRTVDDLAACCHCAPKGMRVLLDALCVLSLLDKSGDAYSLTRDSAIFLDRASPHYMGDSVEFHLSPFMLSAFLNFTDAVRNGGAAPAVEATVAEDHAVWLRYARVMTPMAMPQARKTAEIAGAVENVLDIAAGHGMFGITILEANPEARCTAVDWPSVLALAAENARLAGVEARWRAIAGSAFDVDPGHGYDLVLLPNILHHFDPAACVALLRRMHAALRPAGRLFVVELIPNDDRVSPSAPAWFATMMLATTHSGDAYTQAEYAAMLSEAGFAPPRAHPVPGSARTLLESVK